MEEAKIIKTILLILYIIFTTPFIFKLLKIVLGGYKNEEDI